MFSWMVRARFAIFSRPIEPVHPVHRYMMEIAMMLRPAAAYPVNSGLVRKGCNEGM